MPSSVGVKTNGEPDPVTVPAVPNVNVAPAGEVTVTLIVGRAVVPGSVAAAVTVTGWPSLPVGDTENAVTVGARLDTVTVSGAAVVAVAVPPSSSRATTVTT